MLLDALPQHSSPWPKGRVRLRGARFEEQHASGTRNGDPLVTQLPGTHHAIAIHREAGGGGPGQGAGALSHQLA